MLGAGRKMPDTATQGQHPNGQRYIVIRFGFIVHQRTAHQAMKLAYDILSLLCPECGELLAGNRCTGCGAVFEYMQEEKRNDQDRHPT